MDFDAALRKHAEWKFRFREAVRQSTSFDVSTIARDNQCDLGKWLHGEGKSKHSANPMYAKLVKDHAAFHAEAAKVAALINSGRSAELDRAIAPGAPFAEASKIVGVSLIALKNSAS